MGSIFRPYYITIILCCIIGLKQLVPDSVYFLEVLSLDDHFHCVCHPIRASPCGIDQDQAAQNVQSDR